MIRLFCVTIFIINKEGTKSLFLNHKKLQKWMPPGGKIDPNELPDDAAHRECFEETGLEIQLLGEKASVPGGLMRPFGIQCSPVIVGEKEHIDLVYLATPLNDKAPIANEREASDIRWISLEEIVAPQFNTFKSVKDWVLFFQKEYKKYITY